MSEVQEEKSLAHNDLIPSPFGDLDQITIDSILKGDCSRLSQEQRNKYFIWKCQRDGLDPHAKPFVWATMGGKMVLVPTKGRYEQLRARKGLNCIITKEEYLPSFDPKTGEIQKHNQFYKVWVEVSDSSGRREQNFSSEPIGHLALTDRSNAEKKVVTQAQNRATAAFLGEGTLDDTQVESIKGGKILDPPRLQHTVSNVASEKILEAEVVK